MLSIESSGRQASLKLWGYFPSRRFEYDANNFDDILRMLFKGERMNWQSSCNFCVCCDLANKYREVCFIIINFLVRYNATILLYRSVRTANNILLHHCCVTRSKVWCLASESSAMLPYSFVRSHRRPISRCVDPRVTLLQPLEPACSIFYV